MRNKKARRMIRKSRRGLKKGIYRRVVKNKKRKKTFWNIEFSDIWNNDLKF